MQVFDEIIVTALSCHILFTNISLVLLRVFGTKIPQKPCTQVLCRVRIENLP